VNQHGEAVLTGKPALLGGSPLRPEATGYGLVYMAQLAVKRKLGLSMEGLRVAVSGSGNVAQYASQKLLEFGAKVITMSDSNGVLIFDNGMTQQDWDAIIKCKQVSRARLSSLKGSVSGRFVANETPWSVDIKCDLALPSATQNELDEDGVKLLIKNGVLGVFEGANLPTNAKGQDVIREHPELIYIPGKAANAGGVGVSGLEMAQNAQRLIWREDKVDEHLKSMMTEIYRQMEDAAGKDGTFEEGANRAGFLKVAQAMQQLGHIW
jgi:glutamate dehydrogenase (NADP+)